MTEHFHFSPRPNRAHEIRWQPWGRQAFAQAQAEDKPILLSLSAVWCHWCHVMDETTYSSPAVIAAINAQFVPIRVDNDRRPDINARYNMGGWPTTAFLMPGGETITGATYVPPQQMEPLLERVAAFYHENKAQILERVAGEQPRRLERAAESSTLDQHIGDNVMQAIIDLYDSEYGGFGSAPKFPMTDALELLLDRWLRTRDARLGEMLERTLDAMADGGMYDHVEGGWFRYSTDRQWRVPHFEKMAEDHAALLRVYARYARATGDTHLRERVAAAICWLMSALYDPESGLFGGSQDADEAYYAKPLAERQAMRAPYIDRTPYTNWNAGLAGALFEVGPLLDDETLTERGVRALDVLWEQTRDQGRGLLYHFIEPGGAPHAWGLLTDQVAMLRALLDAHAATGASRMLERAELLADDTVRLLGAEEGGFFDRVPEGEALGALSLADRPLAENASMAGSLLRLAALADRPDLRETAERTLRLLAGGYLKAGTFAAPFALAAARALAPTELVTIVARDAHEPVHELLDAAGALRLREPFAEVRVLRAEGDGERLARSGYPLPGEGSVAYVCLGTTCAAPARSAQEVDSAHRVLWAAERC
ncbi:MAG: thioredoxin domain-containing protein [bacterium]|nr:thioredoxin domain-containing protein [bacterium]